MGGCDARLSSVGVRWSDEVDEILTGDLAAAFAYLTPAKGVVIAPMAPLGLRDREAGTVTLTTSLGLWKKLDRVRRNPGVAVAYHAREHGFSDRPGFVLVQGRASFSPTPDRAWLESITPNWDRFLVPRSRRSAGSRSRRLLLAARGDRHPGRTGHRLSGWRRARGPRCLRCRAPSAARLARGAWRRDRVLA